jgi:hypothetical protein
MAAIWCRAVHVAAPRRHSLLRAVALPGMATAVQPPEGPVPLHQAPTP